DPLVTGVQTCALPISELIDVLDQCHSFNPFHLNDGIGFVLDLPIDDLFEENTTIVVSELNSNIRCMSSKVSPNTFVTILHIGIQIGRASCRETDKKSA